jgi:HAD superfamily hydrolase (TIGR01509 family)
MLKAILWDNDGVLVDTEGLYFEATRLTLANAGVELTRELYADISLRQGRSAFDLLRERGVSDDTIEQIRTSRDNRYSALLQSRPLLIDGVEETLASLHGSIRMGVVTSSRKVHFDLIHRSTGILDYFELVLTREDYRQTKPDPEPYRTALERAGLAAQECVVVEDTEGGMLSAVAAEIRCLVIPNTLNRHGDFSAAHRILTNVREVAPVITQMRSTS